MISSADDFFITMSALYLKCRKALVKFSINSLSLISGFSETVLGHLQVVQDMAAELLTMFSKSSNIMSVLISLHWLPIKFNIQFKILAITLSNIAIDLLEIYCNVTSPTGL